MILVNLQFAYLVPPEDLSSLLLHEALGALGIRDDNYQINIIFKLLSVNEEKKLNLNNEQLLAYADELLNIRYAGGGSTGVSGGGDFLDWKLKLNVILFGLHKINQNPSSCYYKQSMDFLRRMNGKTIGVKYENLDPRVKTYAPDIIVDSDIAYLIWAGSKDYSKLEKLVPIYNDLIQETLEEICLN